MSLVPNRQLTLHRMPVFHVMVSNHTARRRPLNLPTHSSLSAAHHMALETSRPQTGKIQFWRTGTLPPHISRPHQPHKSVHCLNLEAKRSTQAHNGPRKGSHALVACHHSGHDAKVASHEAPCRLPLYVHIQPALRRCDGTITNSRTRAAHSSAHPLTKRVMPDV